MGIPSYKIVFDGRRIKEGEDHEQTKVRLAKLFKTDVTAIEKLFTNRSVVIKSGLNKQQALKYKQTIEKTGALCQIVCETEQAPRKPMAAPPRPSPKASEKKPLPFSDIPPGTTIHRFTRQYQEVGLYAYLLWPFVKIKQVFDAIFDVILGMIWHELMGGDHLPGQIAQLIAFAIFSTLAFVMPHIPDVIRFLLIFTIILTWVVDRSFARKGYFQKIKHEKISLRVDNEREMTWKKVDHVGEAYTIEVSRMELSQITVRQEERFGGAYYGKIGTMWLVLLESEDGLELLLEEHQDVSRALQRARKLAEKIHLPLKFAESEGEGELAFSEPKLARSTVRMKQRHFSSGNVRAKKSDTSIELSSSWNLKSLSRFVQTVVKDSGFLLFILIMEGILLRYGTFLNWFIGPYLGMPSTTLYLDLSFSGILGFFTPDADWIDMAEVAFAVGLMLHRGWKISRTKRVHIDSEKSTFFVGCKELGVLKTSEMRQPLFISSPTFFLLAMDRQRAVTIEYLQTENEYRALMLEMQEAFAAFSDSQNRSAS